MTGAEGKAGRHAVGMMHIPCVLAICGVLAGCVSGDFGRTRASFVNDDMHSWVGVEAVGSIGEPASVFQLTDDERTLRDLAYPFIEPPHERPAFAGVFGDYVRYPAPWRQAPFFDETRYGQLLIAEPRRSPASRYALLVDDIRNDTTRIGPFSTIALRVLDLDAKRKASLAYVSELSPDELANALARTRENALIVEWVQQCVQRRIASYRWALGRLVVIVPDPAAVEAERALAQLAQRAASPVFGGAPMARRPLAVRG